MNVSQGHFEEGSCVGALVDGALVGIWEVLGIAVPEGAELGAPDLLGTPVGIKLGTIETVGSADGTPLIVGALVGTLVGFTVTGFLLVLGLFVGLAVGVFFKADGFDGAFVGAVGTLVFLIGAVVGVKVG